MDSGFIDLDILLTRIRDTQSRVYFLDAVKAYKAGALRASLASAWVALVFDLIAKYRELSVLGDVAARDFITSWDKATANNEVDTLLKLERTILDDATDKTQVINHIAKKQLNRIKEDRHLCAHPAFSAETVLFEPSSELVRLHLFNTVDLVLSQEPLQGKAIFDQFDIDVQSTGFPIEHENIVNYVEQRYLDRVRSPNINNFGIVLAKSLLKGVPSEWESQHNKIISSLVTVRDRAVEAWPDVSSAIVQIVDNLDPCNRPRAIAFIADFPDFWLMLEQATKTVLTETVTNIDSTSFDDYRLLKGVSSEQFKKPLLALISKLDQDQLEKAIAVKPLAELWSPAVKFYKLSNSFRESENNFRKLITPFSGYLDSQQHNQLLHAVMEEGQNWHASDTSKLLTGMLRDASQDQLPTHEVRDSFFKHSAYQKHASEYEDMLTRLTSDGWEAPVSDQVSAE